MAHTRCNYCHADLDRCYPCSGSGDSWLLGSCGVCGGAGVVCPTHGDRFD